MIPHASLKLLLLMALLAAGAAIAFWRNDAETIRQYVVTRAAPRDRMLAAIIPADDKAWFFKLAGRATEMEAQVGPFRQLIESVRFGAGPAASPTWTAPQGWTNRPGIPMRFATLEVPSGDSKLECSVTVLPLTIQDQNEYLIANINRWRDQMRLPSIGQSELESTTQRIPLSGELTATLVDLSGELTASARGDRGAGPAPLAASARSPSDSPSNQDPGGTLKHDLPEGWVPGELDVSRGGITVRRAAAFEIREGNSRAEVTVTRLPAGDSLGNINRWRGQIGLGPMSAAEYQESKRAIEFAGSSADYVQFIGSQEAILGVIAVRGNMAWYAKLQGPAELAGRERQRFEDFVRSIRVE